MRNNPMAFFSENVDSWGPLEWFDRLAKAVHARSQAVRDKDDIAFETYKNIASSSASRLVSDFEEKVRMALTTLRELEKANVAYVDANTALLRENEGLKKDRYALAYAITGGEDAPGLLDSVPTSQLVEIAGNTHRSHSADIDQAMAVEAEVKRLREALQNVAETELSGHLDFHKPKHSGYAAFEIARAALSNTGDTHGN